MTEGTLRGAVSLTAFPIKAEGAAVRLEPGLGWRLLQLATDFGGLVIAGLATYGIYLLSGLGRRDYDPAFYSQIILSFAVVTLFALVGFGTYRSQMGLLRIESVRRLLHAVAAGLALTVALSFLLKFPAFSRLTILMLGPVAIVVLAVQRVILWRIQDSVRAKYSKPVVVYGAGETGRLLAQHLVEDHSLGLKPVAFIDDDPDMYGKMVRVGAGIDGERVRVMGSEAELDRIIGATETTAVFLAMPSASSERVSQLVAKLESRGVRCFFVPSAGELMFSGLQFGQVAGLPVFTRRVQVRDRAYEIAKRVIDVIFGSLALFVALPFIGVSALLLKLTSPGPVFFTQLRCGLHGHPFKIYKLRTMRVDAPKYARHPNSASDDRITRVGRWLRRLSIDELPQLWNVVLGDMSLVGPRPEMPGPVSSYNDIQRQRLAVKPGITGLWQISADRAFLIHDNIHYDLYYLENRSMSLDVAILAVTPFVLLGRNRAM
jgi:exopolysaccharide biosynthesis polyprenyl glycosylphosphotransferase